jgi:hypothetical protein
VTSNNALLSIVVSLTSALFSLFIFFLGLSGKRRQKIAI